jgi:hypothetical protein
VPLVRRSFSRFLLFAANSFSGFVIAPKFTLSLADAFSFVLLSYFQLSDFFGIFFGL